MKKNMEKDLVFILLIPILFISIITVGLIPSATGINDKVKEMFTYDGCCSYMEESQSHLSTLLLFSSIVENQIK